MTDQQDIALISHLMRRAGFGATRAEVEALAKNGYEAAVEQLLHPESQPEFDEYELYRYHPLAEFTAYLQQGQMNWLYRMAVSSRPLEEKMALFWHHVFATGHAKVEATYDLLAQIQMFRDHGMGNLRDLLVRLAQDPAMIFWLDNNENHKRQPNENWGRELLELFSMGIGNYTEKDVFEVSRAFTGWTFSHKIPIHPWGPFNWKFEYRPQDHDFGDKTFLGHTGKFNGEDIVDIIVQQQGCHTFIARHLYNFFVADEPQVPAWSIEPPRDPAAIEFLSDKLRDSNYELKPVLRAMFNADFFKQATYKRVKSPIELVISTLRLTGDMAGPDPRWGMLGELTTNMGQKVLDPPSVEGWHTGLEWINSGSLMQRVNFAAARLGNPELPGVKELIGRIAASNGKLMSPEALVDHCLDLVGPLTVKAQTRHELIGHVAPGGPLKWTTQAEYAKSSQRAAEVLALIAGTREFQFE
ncbi:MAG: DUF1800 domain-containing protein [SAR202 cluster bacterium]|nr:DUF1800 domain-containing protein [SAR202 cluster bacterium]